MYRGVCRIEESKRDVEVARDRQLWEDWTIPRPEGGRWGNGVTSTCPELQLGKQGDEAEEFGHCHKHSRKAETTQRKKFQIVFFILLCGPPIGQTQQNARGQESELCNPTGSTLGQNKTESKLGVWDAASKVALNEPSLLVFIRLCNILPLKVGWT